MEVRVFSGSIMVQIAVIGAMLGAVFMWAVAKEKISDLVLL